MSFIKDFKSFLLKGDIVNLATAVILAGAFGAIVKSFTTDILMPPIGMALGGVDFSELKYVLKDAQPESVINGETVAAIEAVTINYGNFIQIVINFIIIGLFIFMVLKAYERTKKKEAAAPAAPPAPSAEEKLLTDIRDLLKNKQ
ncbi:large-conductance mechanosensitive channel protein MscL [Flavobacterium arcticum]|uniref:Large-conductance mechanosensitive channel n=1 Tax=Flavobacterium arcticum TaxID=1784713 RepID=A0A345HAJ4_9FLAO|nr:large-conductance mechanosensitive channel protein MscL [Flavobacterium arcticum]AXG73604.1 large-conductance mechanosensitive channel protein MscL [Flavobacterium arcticum]KAF2506417.1 large-conductance mechanosensitive channel protein MscL [Flavobacterium arcticum]